MWTAFPPSDYYADSAARAHRPASGLAGLQPAARRAQGASHVHHDPFDRVGSSLYPYSPSGGHSQHPTGHHARVNIRASSEPPSKGAASLLSTTQIRQVSGRSRNRGASTTSSLSLFLSVSLARTRASGSAARPPRCRGASPRWRSIPRLTAPQLLRAAASARGRHSSRHGQRVFVRRLLSHGAWSRIFDFLGFNVRRYRDKTLIKPSKTTIRRIRARLRTELRSLRGSNAQAVIGDSTRSSGDGPTTTGHRFQRHVQRAGRLPVAAHMEMGQIQPPEQTEAPGSSPGTSTGSTSPGKTGGCSATATAAPTCTGSLARYPPTLDRQARSVTRRPSACRLLGLATTQGACRSTRPPRSSTNSQDGRCSICRGLLFAVENPPQSPHEWAKWLATRTAVITTATRPGSSEEAAPRLIHAECRRGSTRNCGTPTKPQGLLEPDAGKRARPVLRGTGRSNAPGLPTIDAMSHVVSELPIGGSANVMLSV